MHQAEVVAELSHLWQPVRRPRGVEVIDREADAGEACGGDRLGADPEVDRAQVTSVDRHRVAGMGPAGRLTAVLHHDLRYDMRLACHVIMQVQGHRRSDRVGSVPIHIVTPHNIPLLPS